MTSGETFQAQIMFGYRLEMSSPWRSSKTLTPGDEEELATVDVVERSYRLVELVPPGVPGNEHATVMDLTDLNRCLHAADGCPRQLLDEFSRV